MTPPRRRRTRCRVDELVLLVLASKGEQGRVDDSSTQAQDQVQGRLFLDVVILECAAILELLASEDQTLLIRGDALLVLDLGLDSLDSVGALNLEGDGLSRERLHKDLYLCGVRGSR